MPGCGHERRSRAGTRAGTALVAPTWRNPWLLLAALAISLAGIVDRRRALPQVEMVGMNLRLEGWRGVAGCCPGRRERTGKMLEQCEIRCDPVRLVQPGSFAAAWWAALHPVTWGQHFVEGGFCAAGFGMPVIAPFDDWR